METICLETSGFNYLEKRHQIPQRRNLKIQSAADIPANNRLLLWRSYETRNNTVWLNTDYLSVRVDEAYTECLQKNGAVSKINKKFISHLTRAKYTPSAAATVQVSHALPAVRFSCLMQGHGASFQDGVAAGKGFLCAPFWGVQLGDYSAAWVSCTV